MHIIAYNKSLLGKTGFSEIWKCVVMGINELPNGPCRYENAMSVTIKHWMRQTVVMSLHPSCCLLLILGLLI